MKQRLVGLALLGLLAISLFPMISTTSAKPDKCQQVMDHATRDLTHLKDLISHLIDVGVPNHVIQHFVDMYQQHRAEWAIEIGAAC